MMENAGTLASALIVDELSKADWLPAYDICVLISNLKSWSFVEKATTGGDGFCGGKKDV